MTRKDYQAIAGALAHVEAITEDVDINGIGASTLRLVVDALALELKQDNPRFDRARFEVAALPKQNERRVEAIKAALAGDPAETITAYIEREELL